VCLFFASSNCNKDMLPAATAAIGWVNDWLRADTLLASAKAGCVLDAWPEVLAYWVPVSLHAAGKLKPHDAGGGAGGPSPASGAGGAGGVAVAESLERAGAAAQGRTMALDLLLALAMQLQAGLPSTAVQAILAVHQCRHSKRPTDWSTEQRYDALVQAYHSLDHPLTRAREATPGDPLGVPFVHKDQVLVSAACGGRQLLHLEHARQIKAHLQRHDDIAAAKLFAVYSQDSAAADAAAVVGISLNPPGVLPAALPAMIRSLGASGPALFRAARALGAVGPRCTFDGGATAAEVTPPHGFAVHPGHNFTLVTKFADAVWVGTVTARK